MVIIISERKNYLFKNCVPWGMKYLDFLWALDFLYRHYPKYHSNELLILADDIFKWMGGELPEDSSALVYLKSCFSSPHEALSAVWKEILLLAGPFSRPN
jgi:hypothetical protein